ncbi:MAG: DNA polymerase III subunit beta [Gammaproteobacteria bacterium]
MNIKLDREKIFPTLSRAGSVVEKRQTLPMLAHLHFGLHGGNLTVVGTDMEVEISELVGDIAGEDGAFTVPMQKILDIIRMFPENAPISFDVQKNKVVVTSARSRYTLNTLSPDDFPRIPTENWEERFKVSQLALKALLDKTAFAMAVSDVRYYLNGVLVELEGKQLRAIATNGHRLAQSDIDIELDAGEARKLIVPRKAILEINRFIAADEGEDAELSVEINPNHLKLSKSGMTFISKLIDGKFPEFKGVFEKEADVIVSVDRLELLDVLSRAAVLVTSGDQGKGVQITLEEGTMRITGKNMEQEEAVEEISVQYTGKPVEAGYNVEYLIDVMRAAGDEMIEFHIRASDGVCILKQPDDKRTLWLIMPVRL